MKSMPSAASRSFVSRDHTECMAIGSIASRSRRAGDASCTGGGTAPAGEGTKNALMTSSYVTDRHPRTATRDWATWGCSPRTCSGWCASSASASSPRSTPMARRTCRRRAPPTCGTAITCGSPTSARRTRSTTSAAVRGWRATSSIRSCARATASRALAASTASARRCSLPAWSGWSPTARSSPTGWSTSCSSRCGLPLRSPRRPTTTARSARRISSPPMRRASLRCIRRSGPDDAVTSTGATSLVLIFAAIAAAPILADLLARWVRVPSVVIEIAAGVVLGPALHWVHLDDVINVLASFGLAALMFLAGMEIDLPRVAGRPLNTALTGWGISLLLGVGVGVAMIPLDGAHSGLIVGLAITTTALGTLLPILRDAGELGTEFGTHVLAGASVGELGPIVAVSLLLSSERPARTVAVLLGFVLLTVFAAWIALRGRGQRLTRLIEDTLTTSGQLLVRIVVLFLAFMVWVAFELGLDTLLGAFAAGMVFRLFSAGSSEREAELVEAKLQALGFGFLVPVFFVVSGVKFDLQAITDDPTLLLFAVGFLALFLVVRGIPAALLYRSGTGAERSALALYLATELPLVVVITSIGVEAGRLEPGKAAALVTAAMLSVLIYPVAAGALRARTASPAVVEAMDA